MEHDGSIKPTGNILAKNPGFEFNQDTGSKSMTGSCVSTSNSVTEELDVELLNLSCVQIIFLQHMSQINFNFVVKTVWYKHMKVKSLC